MNERPSILRLFVSASLVGACVGANHAKPAAPAAMLTIVSGSKQTATAYASVRAPRYETHFAQPLRVSVRGTDEDIRFVCATPGCEFVAAEQADPDTVNRVSKNSYDVKPKKGVALLNIIASTIQPAQTIVITARPGTDVHARGVRFELTTR